MGLNGNSLRLPPPRSFSMNRMGRLSVLLAPQGSDESMLRVVQTTNHVLREHAALPWLESWALRDRNTHSLRANSTNQIELKYVGGTYLCTPARSNYSVSLSHPQHLIFIRERLLKFLVAGISRPSLETACSVANPS